MKPKMLTDEEGNEYPETVGCLSDSEIQALGEAGMLWEFTFSDGTRNYMPTMMALQVQRAFPND